MSRACALVLVLVLAACPGPKPAAKPAIKDQTSIPEQDLRAEITAELQDDILKSYTRDEAPEYQSGMWLPEVGPARIGVGPGDVLLAAELARAPSRFPLDVDKQTRTEPRSKRLEIHIADDGTAAWTFDEISWRIQMCGRLAVIPLRATSLFARDGDRWVPVFEHLSFGRTPMPTRAGQKLPRQIFTAVASRDLADELSRVLSPTLRRTLDKAPLTVGKDTAMIGVDGAAEWRGAEVAATRLAPGIEPMKLEDRRVGIVGRSLAKATVAYWIGNVTVDLPARPGVDAGKGHFRVTFVFEKRKAKWVIVQGHLSHAIEDTELAAEVFGTSLISPKPLAISCDDGTPPDKAKKVTAPGTPQPAPATPGKAAGSR